VRPKRPALRPRDNAAAGVDRAGLDHLRTVDRLAGTLANADVRSPVSGVSALARHLRRRHHPAP